jgi:hypothetical protein
MDEKRQQINPTSRSGRAGLARMSPVWSVAWSFVSLLFRNGGSIVKASDALKSSRAWESTHHLGKDGSNTRRCTASTSRPVSHQWRAALRGAFSSSSSCTPSCSPSFVQGGCHASARVLGRHNDAEPETACGKCNFSYDKREGHHKLSVHRASRIRTGYNTDKRASHDLTSRRLLVP